MDSIITKIDVDLYNPTSYEVIKAQQGDNNRFVEISLKDNGNEYEISSGTKITFEGIRGDSSSFLIDDLPHSANNITIDLTQVISSAGLASGKVILYESYTKDKTAILSSIPIRISVQATSFDKDKVYESNQDVIDSLIGMVTHVSETEIMSKEKPASQENGRFWLEILN